MGPIAPNFQSIAGIIYHIHTYLLLCFAVDFATLTMRIAPFVIPVGAGSMMSIIHGSNRNNNTHIFSIRSNLVAYCCCSTKFSVCFSFLPHFSWRVFLFPTFSFFCIFVVLSSVVVCFLSHCRDHMALLLFLVFAILFSLLLVCLLCLPFGIIIKIVLFPPTVLQFSCHAKQLPLMTAGHFRYVCIIPHFPCRENLFLPPVHKLNLGFASSPTAHRILSDNTKPCASHQVHASPPFSGRPRVIINTSYTHLFTPRAYD